MISVAIVLFAVLGGIFAFRTGRVQAFMGALSGQYKLAGT